jgi:DNA-binding GntR family transcriptional regulator
MAAADLTSSVQLVYERTRRAIIEGRYQPGSPLRIHQLAAENGVSLIPVREAIRMLAADALVEVIPNRGARVAPLSVEDMLDMYRTRIVLEGEALRQAAPNITPDVLTEARALIGRFVAALERRDDTAYEYHRALHFLLYERSRSRWLLRLIAILWDHTERYRRLSIPRVTQESVVDEHGAILDCLQIGDADGAVRALQHHLENSIRFHQALHADADGATTASVGSRRRTRHLQPA